MKILMLVILLNLLALSCTAQVFEVRDMETDRVLVRFEAVEDEKLKEFLAQCTWKFYAFRYGIDTYCIETRKTPKKLGVKNI